MLLLCLSYSLKSAMSQNPYPYFALITMIYLEDIVIIDLPKLMLRE